MRKVGFISCLTDDGGPSKFRVELNPDENTDISLTLLRPLGLSSLPTYYDKLPNVLLSATIIVQDQSQEDSRTGRTVRSSQQKRLRDKPPTNRFCGTDEGGGEWVWGGIKMQR